MLLSHCLQMAAQQIPPWSLVLEAVNTFSLVADPFCEEWEGQRMIAPAAPAPAAVALQAQSGARKTGATS